MKDKDSDTPKETSKRSGFKKFFSRGKAEATSRSNAVTVASTGADSAATQRAETGPISISQGAAQPLKADPSSTSTSKDAAPEIYSSLWEKALDTLKESKKESDRDAYQQLKRILKDPKTVSLHDINKAQEDDLKNLSSKRDKQRFGNRRHVIRAASYMLLFRGPAAAAGRFDATGAATIAVQATTSLIGVALAKIELDQSVYIQLEDICLKTRTWASKEAKILGRRRDQYLDAFEKAEDDLVQVYRSILMWTASAYKYINGTMSRTPPLTTPYFPNEIQAAKADVDIKHRRCEASFDLIKAESDFYDNNRKTLDWISDAKHIVAHRELIKSSKVDDSYSLCGEWLLGSREFEAWNAGSGLQVLWIVGTAGTGKSTLSCRVIEELRSFSAKANDTSFAYVYCSRIAAGGAKDTETVLGSLIRQLAEIEGKNEIVEPLDSFYRKHNHERSKGAELSRREQDELVGETFDLGIETRIIIDALDECRDWNVLLSALAKAVKHHKGNMKIFLTSREEVKVQEYFPTSTTKVLAAELTQFDMEVFVRGEIFGHEREDRLLRGKHPEIEERLVLALLKRAQGMFQWVKLRLTWFFAAPDSPPVDRKDVEDEIRKIENNRATADDTLRGTYTDILKRNNNGRRAREIAKRAFQITLAAFSPGLSLAELVAVLAIKDVDALEHSSTNMDAEVDEDYVKARTRNLLRPVEIPRDGPDVLKREVTHMQFSHMSVVDYLLSSDEGAAYSTGECHQYLLRICLYEIRIMNDIDADSLTDGSVTVSDPQHSGEGPDESITGPIQGEAEVDDCANDEDEDSLPSESGTSSDYEHSTEYLGAVVTASVQEDSEADDSGSSMGQSSEYDRGLTSFREYSTHMWPSHCAAALLLLPSRSDLASSLAGDVFCGIWWQEGLSAWPRRLKKLYFNRRFYHGLGQRFASQRPGWLISSCFGLRPLAEELAKHDIYRSLEILNAEVRRIHSAEATVTATAVVNEHRDDLHDALARAPSITEPEHKMLEESDKPNELFTYFFSIGGEVITRAGYVSYLKWIFKKASCETAYQAVVCHVLSLLRGRGFDLNRIWDDETVLVLAVNHELVDVIKYLVRNGAHINLRTKGLKSVTAWEAAAQASDIEVMDVLISMAPADERPGMLVSIWQHAVQTVFSTDYLSYVRSLDQDIQHGLSAALNDGSVLWSHHLIEVGAMVKLEGLRQKVLHQLVANYPGGDEQAAINLIPLLVSRGLDLNACDDTGVTPLMIATLTGEPFLAYALLRLGANVNATDHSGRSVLHYSIPKDGWHTSFGGEEWPQLWEILNRFGVDTGHADEDGVTALDLARVSQCEEPLVALSQLNAGVEFIDSLTIEPNFEFQEVVRNRYKIWSYLATGILPENADGMIDAAVAWKDKINARDGYVEPEEVHVRLAARKELKDASPS
ncbi:uncharacterized protein AB675_3383 [Cyphellophora attinorum]|uniref:Nephrocystin 3-like N-terminal domain-containing protein n=1 Tax=Cyphellophora attinorum TaxID=1664694 RepID=A0A0N1H8S1_9EURO|nr:uncharacterized protein AB675_3383 [Phialophora attinorum]KPI39824.1 hypothetical protein AB675_3383 [Phialophora attinorum]